MLKPCLAHKRRCSGDCKRERLRPSRTEDCKRGRDVLNNRRCCGADSKASRDVCELRRWCHHELEVLKHRTGHKRWRSEDGKCKLDVLNLDCTAVDSHRLPRKAHNKRLISPLSAMLLDAVLQDGDEPLLTLKPQ